MHSFALITRRIIARDGISCFLPTVLFSQRDHLAVLEGVPGDADLAVVTRKWATSMARPDEPFLLAYRSGPNCFAIVYCHGKHMELTNHVI